MNAATALMTSHNNVAMLRTQLHALLLVQMHPLSTSWVLTMGSATTLQVRLLRCGSALLEHSLWALLHQQAKMQVLPGRVRVRVQELE
jgi:hypothetical protein